MTQKTAKPFIKWAGGKTQLLPQLRKHYPARTPSIYIEPFVGAGAVMFDVIKHYPELEKIVINDINSSLVNVYRTIQTAPEELITELQRLQDLYVPKNDEGRTELYYAVRSDFNQAKEVASIMQDPVTSAAQFIFLNKTGFNGLYRVNKKGALNVPHGRYTKPLIADVENIRAANEVLQKVMILEGDYQEIANYMTDDAFLYFDPPYRPLDISASFNSYDSSGFNDAAQQRLAEFVTNLSQEYNATILLSNSDPKNINPADDFFDDLYAEFEIERISATRAISSKATTRGKITEILVHKALREKAEDGDKEDRIRKQKHALRVLRENTKTLDALEMLTDSKFRSDAQR